MNKNVLINPRPALKNPDDWVKGEPTPYEPPRMKRLTLDVTEDLHRRIKTACAARGMIMADTLRELLEKEFR